MREVKELVILDNLGVEHATIRSELRYLIGAKVPGTVKLEPRGRYNPAKNRGFMSGPDNNPAKTMRFGFLAGSGTEQNRTAGPNPDRWRVTRTRC
jgi:hypothetical protein